MKLSEALVQYITWMNFSKRESTRKGYRHSLMQFSLYMRNCEIETVLLGDVLGYLEMMQTVGWDANSFLAKTVALRKFFEYFGKQKLCTFDFTLIPIMEREYVTPKVAKLDDYTKVLNAIPENNDPRHIRNRTILMLFKDTGMRLGELLSINIQDLDLGKMEAVIKTEKTKKLHPLRKVFWTQDTNDQIKKWIIKMKTLERVDKEALFISATGIRRGHRLNKGGGTEVMRRLSNAAGLSYVLNSHSLRHMFGHDMAKAKLPNSTISTMLGHSTPVSSYVYTMLNDKEMSHTYRDFREHPELYTEGDS